MIPPDIRENPTDNGTALGANPTATSPISPDGTPELGRRYTVPARQGRAVRLAQGQAIAVLNPHGTQVCDLWAFNAANLAEYLSWEHARGALDRIVPRVGDALLTNRRRPILTLTEDTSPGVHDTLIAACDLFRYLNLGVRDYHDNCADNLRMALTAIGLTPLEVPQPFNVWMNIPVGPDGVIDWLPPVSKPGDRLTLRAAMDCIVVMSACPQDMIPINGRDMRPVELAFEVTA
jgi:uncharacterized protein YcgI (DUF1989 family)